MTSAIRHLAPDRLQIREGGGCLTLFGLPFLGAGMFLTLTSLGLIPVGNADELPAFGWLLLLLMGLIFAAVGGVLAFGRTWITIDATQGLVVKEWGLLVPMRVRTHRAGDYCAVRLEFEAGDSDSADRFPVSLRSKAGPDLAVVSSTEYASSRGYASAIARHLRLEIEDATTDHPTRLSVDAAEQPLQHRLQIDRRVEPAAERPQTARSEVTARDGAVRIEIPFPRLHPLVFAVMLIPLAISLVAVAPLSRFFRETKTPDAVGWIFLGFLVLFFGVLPALTTLSALLRSRIGRTIVTVSRDGLTVEDRGAWRTRTTARVAATDILDVDYSTSESLAASARRGAEERLPNPGHAAAAPGAIGPRTERLIAALGRFAKGRGVTVKSRNGLTTFGQGLADAEIRYLHSVVRRGLVGDQALSR